MESSVWRREVLTSIKHLQHISRSGADTSPNSGPSDEDPLRSYREPAPSPVTPRNIETLTSKELQKARNKKRRQEEEAIMVGFFDAAYRNED
jgi:hypothetical protein